MVQSGYVQNLRHYHCSYQNFLDCRLQVNSNCYIQFTSRFVILIV
jgi:hypothetical protein